MSAGILIDNDPVGAVEIHLENYYDEYDLPEERIEEWGDSLKYPERYAVYVIKTEGYDHTAYGTDEKFKEDWRYWAKAYNEEEYSGRTYPLDPPKWAWAAYYADEAYYVGYSSDLYSRLQDHVYDPEKTSIFICVFQPEELVEVKWCKMESQASLLESETADEYSDQVEDKFAYYA